MYLHKRLCIILFILIDSSLCQELNNQPAILPNDEAKIFKPGDIIHYTCILENASSDNNLYWYHDRETSPLKPPTLIERSDTKPGLDSTRLELNYLVEETDNFTQIFCQNRYWNATLGKSEILGVSMKILLVLEGTDLNTQYNGKTLKEVLSFEELLNLGTDESWSIILISTSVFVALVLIILISCLYYKIKKPRQRSAPIESIDNIYEDLYATPITQTTNKHNEPDNLQFTNYVTLQQLKGSKDENLHYSYATVNPKMLLRAHQTIEL